MEEVNFQTKTRVAIGFAGWVQKDSNGHGKQVQVGTVRAALGVVNASIALDTAQKPLHEPESNNKYILPLQHMLQRFEKKDPPQVKKLAMHLHFPDYLCK